MDDRVVGMLLAGARAVVRRWLGASLLALMPAAQGLAEAEQCRIVADQEAGASFRFETSRPHLDLALQIPPGTPIRSIRVQRYAVFDSTDPQENNRLYRWANEFHSLTRESVIRDQLLISSGDGYDWRRLQESARILRNLKFIYDARVRPWRWCADGVDVEVITRDIWTFTPIVSFSRSGGENRYEVGFRDSNFLGTGKQIHLSHERDEERSGNTLVYSDPAVAGSRWRFRLSLTENDDGHDRSVSLERPFFSVYERWAFGTGAVQQELEQSLWFRGDEVAEFDHRRDSLRLYGGWADGEVSSGAVNRWLFGYQYENHQFDYSDSPIPPPQLPADRAYSYPFVGYQSVEDEYAQVHNLNYLGRTEDLYVGRQYQVSLGWSGEALGASADQLAFFARYGDTLRVNTRQLWTVDTFARGYWSPSESAFENLWWQGETRYHWRQGERWTAFVRLRANYADGLTGENQLTLGGHNGLRGYDVHYQVGDRSVLFNLEQRYYSDWHPFRLVRVGAAVFLDVGRAWYDDRDNGSNGGVLSNAGFGLRFNSSRAEKSSVVHVDFAFPFQRDDDVDSFQVLFTVRDTF